MTVVAIDGPAGAGKSTVARAVAAALGFDYLETGALYRAVALAALERGVDAADPSALGRLVEGLDVEWKDGCVWVDGRAPGDRIRAPDVTRTVSRVAAHPGVRAALLSLQRAVAARGQVVIEGRDIGTVVAPDAEVKVYLTASPAERARRRAVQLGEPEAGPTVEALEEAIVDRDRADSTRAVSPLVPSRDGVTVDSTARGIDDVVGQIVGLVREASR